MKKIKISFTIILISLCSLSFSQTIQNKLENGFYYLAEKEDNSQLISSSDSDKIFGVENTPILTSIDFKNIKEKLINSQPNKINVLEIMLNRNGRRKWNKIRDRIIKSHESIVFVFDDNVMFEKQIFGTNYSIDTNILLPIEIIHKDKIYKKIKSEIENLKLNRTKK